MSEGQRLNLLWTSAKDLLSPAGPRIPDGDRERPAKRPLSDPTSGVTATKLPSSDKASCDEGPLRALPFQGMASFSRPEEVSSKRMAGFSVGAALGVDLPAKPPVQKAAVAASAERPNC